MYIDRIKCEYCGRVNPSSEFDCRGCGAGLMPDPIKHDPEMYNNRPQFKGFGSTVMMLCSTAGLDDSDGSMFMLGDTDTYRLSYST